jgi:RHS repeat-associated protein
LAKHPGRNTFRPCRAIGTKNRRHDYCGQGLLVLLARQKNTPGRVWQRVLFNCPYGHKTNQTYMAAKHPKHLYVRDNLSSTRAVVDEAGDVVEAYDYYPFGLQSRSYKEKGDPLTKETFTGKEQDTESNLHYFGARYYDAGAGRWISVDPLAFKYPSLSGFSYAGNNPIRILDPNGLDLVIVVDGTHNKHHTQESRPEESKTIDGETIKWNNSIWGEGENLGENSFYSFEMNVYNTETGANEGTFDVARDAWFAKYSKDENNSHGENNPAKEGVYEVFESKGSKGKIRGWFWISNLGQAKGMRGELDYGDGIVRIGISIHPGSPRFAAGCLTMSLQQFRVLSKLINAAFDRGERVYIVLQNMKLRWNEKESRWEYVDEEKEAAIKRLVELLKNNTDHEMYIMHRLGKTDMTE